jgi:hypothetical protein
MPLRSSKKVVVIAIVANQTAVDRHSKVAFGITNDSTNLY